MYAVRRSRPPKQMFVVSGIAGGDVLEHLAERRQHRDAAVHERRDADVAVGVDRERVEQLEARQAGEQRAAARRERHALGRPRPAATTSHCQTRPVKVSAT